MLACSSRSSFSEVNDSAGQSEVVFLGRTGLLFPVESKSQIKKPLSGPGSDREKIRILSKQLYLGTDDRLHFASFRASDSSFEGTVVTGLVDLVE